MAKADVVGAVRRLNSSTKQRLRLRKIGIAAYRTATSTFRVFPPPRAFLNGPGKSGTHLLSDCVALLPRFAFSGRHFGLMSYAEDVRRPSQAFSLPADHERLSRFLRMCPNGMFVTAHAEFDEELRSIVSELEFKHVLLMRDPRDVAVSRAFFRKRLSWHPHHRYFTESLTTDEDRVMAVIEGFPASDISPVPLASVADDFRAYLGWLDCPEVLVVRFEDMVGPSGGKSRETQLETVQKIAEFVGRPIEHDEVASVADKMYDKSGFTYRKGIVGDWENHFNDAHRDSFERTAGDLLERLGYES